MDDAPPPQPPLANPWLATRTRTGREYDAPYEARAAAGQDVHGEANLVEKLLQTALDRKPPPPYRVLDGGCGTGRLGIELARRGVTIIGVDLDEEMLKQARAKASHLDWRLGDLSRLAFGADFDAIVLAGNVMIFLTPGTEAATVANLARHLKPGGLLVAAFELTPKPWTVLTIDVYDALAQAAGLGRVARWSTWDQDPWRPGDGYAVAVHRKDAHTPQPKRRLQIDLDELAGAFEDASGMAGYFLDLETGEVALRTEETREEYEAFCEALVNVAADQWEAAFEAALQDHDVPDWQRDMLREADRIETQFGQRYLRVPTPDSHDGYQDMELFLDTVRDPRLRAVLGQALAGRRPFRAFKDALADANGEREGWFAFKQARLHARIVAWLAAEAVEPLSGG